MLNLAVYVNVDPKEKKKCRIMEEKNDTLPLVGKYKRQQATDGCYCPPVKRGVCAGQENIGTQSVLFQLDKHWIQQAVWCSCLD